MAHQGTSLAESVPFDYDGVEDAPPPDQTPLQDVLEFARRLVSYIRSQDHARFTVDCLYLALGDADLEAETMSSIAEKRGVSKAAVSKRVRKIRQDLHLPRTANNKSKHASDLYRRTNASPLRLDRSPPGDSRPPGADPTRRAKV